MERRYWFLGDLDNFDGYEEEKYRAYVPADVQTANLIGSGTGIHEIGSGEEYHLPVFDFDFECALVPSSTKGHYHLYLEKPVPWRHYRRLLKSMEKAGLLQKGWVKASLKRKFTSVRPPWVKKPLPEGPSDDAVVVDKDVESVKAVVNWGEE